MREVYAYIGIPMFMVGAAVFSGFMSSLELSVFSKIGFLVFMSIVGMLLGIVLITIGLY